MTHKSKKLGVLNNQALPSKPKKPFDMQIFLDRMLIKCEDLSNFPIPIPHRTCDHVSWIRHRLNLAAKKAQQGNPRELNELKAQLANMLFQLEDMKQ